MQNLVHAKKESIFSDAPASARNKQFILVSKNAHLISCQPTKSSKLNFRASHLISWHSLQNNSNNKVLDQVLFFKTRQGCHCSFANENMALISIFHFKNTQKEAENSVFGPKKRLFVW